ncbi:uncharacterized protein LOC108907188 [Anoplophora glabripennis]|uniref:uncharacterized protein LOC108907188 n=1 Tax=Anoplophora glabripennis TaxID=217634 RepID=UPI000874B00C|nr:uncharacterized protein LOC108907188 [Anoplophora glabripennis]
MSRDNLLRVRRRSIFDDHEKESKKPKNEHESKLSFPEKKTELHYPIQYVENVMTEIEKWKMHVRGTLEEINKFKSEKKKLQNMTVNEHILSSQQLDLLASFDCEEYVRRVQDFSDWVTIITHKIQNKSESELEKKNLFIQKKLDRQIKDEHFIEDTV